MINKGLEIQRGHAHDEQLLYLGNATEVKLEVKHLHGTESNNLRLHAQYFAHFFFIYLYLKIKKPRKERLMVFT